MWGDCTFNGGDAINQKSLNWYIVDAIFLLTLKETDYFKVRQCPSVPRLVVVGIKLCCFVICRDDIWNVCL